jgi:hypothetical protein
MTDETIEGLKQAYMKHKDNSPDECSMADRISDYAFGELGAEESDSIKEHLKSCHSCLDLYMDIKMAEEEAEQTKMKRLRCYPDCRRPLIKERSLPYHPGRKSVTPFLTFSVADSVSVRWRPLPLLLMVMVLGFYIMRDTTPHAPYAIQIMMQGRTQTGFRGGQPEYKEFQVEPGGEIMSGDYFRFQVTIDNDAFVYVVFQDSSGAIQAMEPDLLPAVPNCPFPMAIIGSILMTIPVSRNFICWPPRSRLTGSVIKLRS